MLITKNLFFMLVAILLLSATTTQATFANPNYDSSINLSTPITPEEANTFSNSNNINLSDYKPASGYPKTVPNVSNQLSGIAWNPNVPDRLFMVNNRDPIAIYVTDLEGKGAKTITLSGFDDPEDITHISGNVFAIVEEKAHEVSYVSITSNTSSISKGNAVKSFKLSGLNPPSPNKGLEGVSYDPVNNQLYSVSEKPLNLYRWNAANSGTFPNPTIGAVPSSFGMTDLSAIYHLGQTQGLDNVNVKDHFLVLSDESNKIIETDDSFNNYGSLSLPTSHGTTQTQFEGITMDNQGNIYLIIEENLLYKYSNKKCSIEVNSETVSACNDNNTPMDCTDDTYTITVNASVNDGSNSYIVRDNHGNSSTVASGANVNLGPYPADGSTTVQLTYSDVSNSGCTSTSVVGPVGSCSANCLSTLTSAISRSKDDAQEISGSGVNPISTTLELGAHTTGFIFKNLGIQKGTKIRKAWIQFSSSMPSSAPTTLKIAGENRTPADFDSPMVNYIKNRPKTRNSVVWDVPAWTQTGQRGTAQKTPDIAPIIQEIVDRNSFKNDIAIIMTGNGSRIAVARDGNPAQAAELVLVYGECPPSGTTCNDGNSDTHNDQYDDNCNCAGTPACDATNTVTAKIIGGENDVEEDGKGGFVDANNTSLQMFSKVQHGNQVIGLRYTDVAIPQGAQICEAYIQFTAASGKNIAGQSRIYVEDSPTSAPFGTTRNDVSTRPKTNGFVWQPPLWDTVGEAGTDQRTVNIATDIQQVVGKQDWDGTITVIMEGTGRRVAESFEGSPGKAPVLHIKFVGNVE